MKRQRIQGINWHVWRAKSGRAYVFHAYNTKRIGGGMKFLYPAISMNYGKYMKSFEIKIYFWTYEFTFLTQEVK